MKLKAVSGIMLTMMLIGTLTLSFNIQQVKSEPTTIIVPDDHEKIQWAIGNASDGDTIFVRAGTYYEHLTIDKSLSLIGENKETTIIDGGGVWLGTVVNITISNVKIEGFSVRNGYHGIYLYNSDDSFISDNSVSGNQKGIILDSSSYNVLSNNIISNNDYEGISLLDYSHENEIKENEVSLNSIGIDINVGSDNNIVFYNTLNQNSFIGLLLHFADRNILVNNNISSNHIGLELWNSKNNRIYHNNFIDNTKHVELLLRPDEINSWDDGYPSGGNYWSAYTGVDVKSGPYQNQPGSDGIGDTPYTINGTNQDNYPLMYPWGSPPPPSYTLIVYSSPTGVMFTVDGVSRTTPWSGIYSEGASVSLVMPETHDGYVWSYWLEDRDPYRIKTVIMDTNITLTALYTRPPTPPVGGKATPINIPTNKPELPALWVWLTILLPLAATTIFVKLKKKKQ